MYLAVNDKLLGATICYVDNPSVTKTILAVWLEESTNPAYRPNLVAVVSDALGEMDKIYLLNGEWKLQSKET